MRRTVITLCTVLALASIMISVVWADNPQFRKGPSYVDNGTTATATGSITGLGNGNVVVTLSFPQATATTTCTNPQGKQSPGQNPAAPAPVSGTASIPDPKNGNLSFTVTTAAPTPPTWDVAGCPNSKWTVTINNVTFGCGTLTIQQDNGSGLQTVLTDNPCLP